MSQSVLRAQVDALRVSVNSLTSRLGKAEMALAAANKQIAALQATSKPPVAGSPFSADFSVDFGRG